MREVVTVVRRLLNRERVNFDGEFVRMQDVELDVVHGRKEARNVPIYIGATGPKMMALTGEIADGAVLNYLVSPKYNEMAMAQLELGAKKAGKIDTGRRSAATGRLLGRRRPRQGPGRRP